MKWLAIDYVVGQRRYKLGHQGFELLRKVPIRQPVTFERAGDDRLVDGGLGVCGFVSHAAERRQEQGGNDSMPGEQMPVAAETASEKLSFEFAVVGFDAVRPDPLGGGVSCPVEQGVKAEAIIQ